MTNTKKAPEHVWYSLYAFLATVALTLSYLLVSIARREIDLHHTDIKVYLLEAIITLLLIRLVFKRRTWARTLYAILTGMALCGVFLMLKQFANLAAYDLVTLALQTLFRVLSVGFLYTTQSREWLRPSVSAPEVTHQCEATERTDSHSPDLHSGELVGAVSLNAPSESEVTTNPRGAISSHSKSKLVKRASVLVGVLVLGVCFTVALVSHVRTTRRADSIREALRADVALARELFGTRMPSDSDERTLRAYTEGLRAVDMSECPRDFQVAYLEHIQAWESLVRTRASADLIGPLVEFLVFKKIPSLSGTSDEKFVHEGIAETWNEVERIALVHGVRVPKR